VGEPSAEIGRNILERESTAASRSSSQPLCVDLDRSAVAGLTCSLERR